MMKKINALKVFAGVACEKHIISVEKKGKNELLL